MSASDVASLDGKVIESEPQKKGKEDEDEVFNFQNAHFYNCPFFQNVLSHYPMTFI